MQRQRPLAFLRGLVPALPGLALLAVLAAVRPGTGAESNAGLTAAKVKDLAARYAAERAAADTEGLTRKFSPEWYEKADALGRQAEKALAAGRLLEARDGFRKARWHLPAVPAHLSGHVARIFGDGRLRHPAIVQSLAFSPDGTRLVTAGQDGTVRVWDADTGREVGFYAGHAERVSAVAYSPDGKWVASGGADPEIKIWDPATGKDVKSLKGHTEFLTGLAFSPDGKYLAAVGGDRRLRIYDVKAGTVKHDLPGHNLLIHGVAYSRDGKSVATVGGDRVLRIWEAATGAAKLGASPNFRGSLFCVAFAPDGQTVAVGGSDPNAAKLLSVADSSERQSFEGHTGAV